MFNSAADLMNPNNFSPYSFTHQPGTSTAAMASAAAAQNSFAALSFEAAAANTLMHGAIRTTNSYRPEIPRGNKRERTKFDAYQLEQMEIFFQKKPYPDGNDREEMAKNLNLTDVKVQIWFKNRRAKDRNQKHLDELMAKSRGDYATQKSLSAAAGRSSSGNGGDVPTKKKRRTESPLPDPMQHQHQQLQLQQQQQQQQQLLLQQQNLHETKNGHGSNNTGEIKQEIDGSTAIADYSNGIFDTSSYDEQKDIKSFNYPNGGYPAAFGFDPIGTFQTHNTTWMTPAYPGYQFPYFPTPYYSAAANPQAYSDLYAASPYASTIPNLKDSSKVELPSTESPNNNNISPTTIFKPTEIEQPYAKFA